mmetsp:Transcript_19035/g.20499  ORF Transcript_19035/g.20499 Transcript_19035/m.20499 type:complete len:100 (-) Transcript_19035:1024-1323(-)
MTVLRIRPYSIACRSCGIEMYFVANTTGRSSTISIRCSNSDATAVCHLPIVVAASNRTRHQIEHGIKLNTAPFDCLLSSRHQIVLIYQPRGLLTERDDR